MHASFGAQSLVSNSDKGDYEWTTGSPDLEKVPQVTIYSRA